jgi:alpha-tubulin suppressor-like RCC1 family protein
MRNLRHRLRRDGAAANADDPELSGWKHRLWCLSVVLVVVAGAVLGPGVAGAVFKATTSNGSSSFTAAAAFQLLALYGWGKNAEGQMGQGNVGSPVTAPQKVGTATNWRSASSGLTHACAVQTDDTLWCWGGNADGQLGRGNVVTPQTTPIQIPGVWQTVGAGYKHTCAIKTDATLWCWGNNGTGAVGDGGIVDVTSPTLIAGAGWTTVAGGADHTCGTQSDGTLWCWGVNSSGAIGQGNVASGYRTPTRVGAADWRSVTVGWGSSCGLKTDNTLWCWGDNTEAQLGRGGRSNSETTPALVNGTGNWRTVHAGFYHQCAIKHDNTLWCWGNNTTGQLGRAGTSDFEGTAAQVGGAVWSTVGGGSGHTCGIQTDNTLWCWGTNSSGQLATGDVTSRSTPTKVTATTPWQYIATGKGDETFAIR